ncbi:BrnT family toxin [Ruminococcus sp.]|uniref:BrnT family toxin n=1 Tax=Ruminococcus sp. TaxID=41978 RepID=UPI002E81924F|nr:BrnT family toxin [Ruminococcus sp.]MEE3491651.1 BrnT family toxin [Ruminococcus sp.]
MITDNINIEWDINKNIKNIKKHNVSFEEAASVFFDEEALMIPDPDHSQQEERFLLLGYSEYAKLLVVCHCYRESNVIRIISARKANKRESNTYYERCE